MGFIEQRYWIYVIEISIGSLLSLSDLLDGCGPSIRVLARCPVHDSGGADCAEDSLDRAYAVSQIEVPISPTQTFSHVLTCVQFPAKPDITNANAAD